MTDADAGVTTTETTASSCGGGVVSPGSVVSLLHEIMVQAIVRPRAQRSAADAHVGEIRTSTEYRHPELPARTF